MTNDATILIIDDTKNNITILLSLLDNYDLLVALNGKKALSLVEKNDINLILLDIMIPEMDGYAVCQEPPTTPIGRGFFLRNKYFQLSRYLVSLCLCRVQIPWSQ